MDNKNIDQLFKEHFHNRSIETSNEAWNRLDILLEAEEKPIAKSNFTINNYYKIAAVAAFVLSMVSVGYYFTMEQDQSVVVEAQEDAFKLHEDDNHINEDLEVISENELEQENSSKILDENIHSESKPTFQSKSHKKPDQSDRQLPIANIPKVIEMDENSTNHDIIEDVASNIHTSEGNIKRSIVVDAKKLLAAVENDIQSVKPNTPMLTKNKHIPNHAILLEQTENKISRTFFQRLYKGVQENTSNMYATISNRNH